LGMLLDVFKQNQYAKSNKKRVITLFFTY
jgi:hypothetical protein